MPEPEVLHVPRQLVIFTVGGIAYGLDIEVVDEILSPRPLTRLPSAPSGILGVIDVRERVVPVFDLHWKFGVPAAAPDDSQRLVLVGTSDGQVALAVDSVREVANVARDMFQSLRTPGDTLGLGYLRGVFRCDGSLVLLVDHERLVPSGLARAAVAA